MMIASILFGMSVRMNAARAATLPVKTLSCFGFDDRIAVPTPGFELAGSVGFLRSSRPARKMPLLFRTDVAATVSVRATQDGSVWFDYGGELAKVSEIRFPGCQDSGHDAQRPWGVRIGALHTSKPMCVVLTLTSDVQIAPTRVRLPVGRSCR